MSRHNFIVVMNKKVLVSQQDTPTEKQKF